MINKWGKKSLERRAQLDPRLQKLFDAVLEVYNISLIQAHRGQEDQTTAKANGLSNANFGESPHNYEPALAGDIYPWPIPQITKNGVLCIDDNSPTWDEMIKVVKAKAVELGIDIICGADWKTLVDKPHVELANWRELIKREDTQNGKN